MRVSKQRKLMQSLACQALDIILVLSSRGAQYGNSHSNAGDIKSTPVGTVSIASGEIRQL
jgi:hypothetical protein